MASTHKILLFLKFSSNLVVLRNVVNLLILVVISVHFNYHNLNIMYKGIKVFFPTTVIHHSLQMSRILEVSYQNSQNIWFSH